MKTEEQVRNFLEAIKRKRQSQKPCHCALCQEGEVLSRGMIASLLVVLEECNDVQSKALENLMKDDAALRREN
jgi:hypothetical protein